MPTTTGAYSIGDVVTTTECLGLGDPTKAGKQFALADKQKLPMGGMCPEDESVGGTLLGWSCCLCHTLRKCPCNMVNALRTRHGAKQTPVTASFANVEKAFTDELAKYIGVYMDCPYLDPKVWLQKWPEGKRKAFEQSWNSHYLKCANVKAMIKVEIYHKAVTRARLIQFYSNLYTQMLYAPQFYAAQKACSKCFTRRDMPGGIDITFASGMSAAAIGDWMAESVRRGARWFYERDGKNWDSSMQRTHFEFKRRLYALFDVELAEFCRRCENVKGFAVFKKFGIVRYRMDATVKSGHNDTTLGNSIVNAAIIHSVMVRLGLRGSIIVTGDDLLVAMHSDFDVAELIACEREFGIYPEARKFMAPEHTSFVSGVFFANDRGGYDFTPTPGRLIARLWWTNKPPPPRKLQQRLRGDARGLMGVCEHMPVIRYFITKFDSIGDSSKTDKSYIYRSTEYAFDATRLSKFAARYELTTSEVLECEHWLSLLPAKPLLLVHPVLTRIMEKDLAGIEDRDVEFA